MDKEVINAVVPLFDEADADLQPYITSKLYHILMTFNVMQNVDTIFENAYMALLSATLVYLLPQPDSAWKKNILNLIYKTIKIAYSNSGGFKKFAETLIKTPRIACVTEHPDINTKCEDLTKAVLVLFFLVTDGQLTDKQQI